MSVKASQVDAFLRRAIEAATVNTDALQSLGASVAHVETVGAGKLFVYFDDGSRAELKTFHNQPVRRKTFP